MGGHGLDQFGLGYWEQAECFERGKDPASSLKLVEFSQLDYELLSSLEGLYVLYAFSYLGSWELLIIQAVNQPACQLISYLISFV